GGDPSGPEAPTVKTRMPPPAPPSPEMIAALETQLDPNERDLGERAVGPEAAPEIPRSLDGPIEREKKAVEVAVRGKQALAELLRGVGIGTEPIPSAGKIRGGTIPQLTPGLGSILPFSASHSAGVVSIAMPTLIARGAGSSGSFTFELGDRSL